MSRAGVLCEFQSDCPDQHLKLKSKIIASHSLRIRIENYRVGVDDRLAQQ